VPSIYRSNHLRPSAPINMEEIQGHLRFSQKHIPVLDGLRGLAIVLVVVFHAAGDCGSVPVTSAQRVVFGLTGAGWCGVDLFFVLSGFLITGVLLDSRGTSGYFRNFYARRTLRIFPLYYGFLTALFLFHLILPGNRFGRAFWADQAWFWTYAQNWMVAWRKAWPPHTSHFWSLAIEEQFYFFWPLMVYLLRNREKALVGLCVAIIAGSLSLRCCMTAEGFAPISIFSATATRLDGLALGSCIRVLSRMPFAAYWLARLAAPVGLVFALLLGGLFLHAPSSGSEYSKEFQTVGYTVLAVVFAAALLRAVASPKGILARLLNQRPLLLLGKISYGVYVFHLPINGLLRQIWPKKWLDQPGLNFPLFLAASAVASVGTATLSWLLFERHFLKLKDHFLPKPKAAAAVSRGLAKSVTS
jgi:peptidoglycan/LPS O-acetylase OafA/YrhL